MAFQGFRAIPSTTQSITFNTITDVNFGSEQFDTENAFASSEFTVPAGLNGKYAVFTAGLYTAATSSMITYIRKSTDSGSTFDIVAWSKNRGDVSAITNGGRTQTGPVLLSTGDIYKVTTFIANNASIQVDERSFFSGVVIQGTFHGFRATKSADQAYTASGLVDVSFDTEIFDTESAFASNVFTVPAALNGAYMAFTAGMDKSGENGDVQFLIQKTDSGGTITTLCADAADFSTDQLTTSTGPVQVFAGDEISVQFRGALDTVIEAASGRTFFSGYVVAPLPT